jgi:energy-coupling factor transporter ATP-binding protein EcfA2
MSRDAEANFSGATKDLLASRAGYRCSFPICGRSTIGPGAGLEEFASIGVGAHVYSAAPGGPRGSGGLTNKQLSHVSNGIWLCQDHAKVIDTNRGNGFPAVTLLSYKGFHEARVMRDMTGMPASYHWIERIVVQNSPIKITGQRWVLGKVNLLIGGNTLGKTALCEWLAGQVDRASLRRWRPGPLRYQIAFFDPTHHELGVELAADTVTYTLDSRTVPMNPLPVRVSWAVQPEFSSDADHVAVVAQALQEGRTEVLALLDYARGLPNRLIFDIELVEDGHEQRLHVRPSADDPSLPLNLIGGGAAALLLIDLAVIRATVLGEYSPTLLIVDEVFSALDPQNKERALRRVSDANLPFQTIVTLPQIDTHVDLTGVSVAELKRSNGSTLICQPQ